MKVNIDAIIVGHNRPEKTITAVNSLKTNNELNSIILVDNGSSDSSYLDYLKVDKIIANPTNVGHAVALNQAFPYSHSKYRLVMHNDIIINEPNWVKRAVDFLDNNEKAGLISSIGWTGNNRIVCSLKSVLRGHPDAMELFDIEGDFVEVGRTDSIMNIYRNLNIKANPKFNIACLSFYLNYLSLGYKLYTMRISDGTHWHGSSMPHKGPDGKFTEAYIKHRENITKVTREMIKELGLK